MKKIITICLFSFCAASAAQADYLVCNMDVTTARTIERDGTGSDSIPFETKLAAGDWTCDISILDMWTMDVTLANAKRDISRMTSNGSAGLRIEDRHGNLIEEASCKCDFR